MPTLTLLHLQLLGLLVELGPRAEDVPAQLLAARLRIDPAEAARLRGDLVRAGLDPAMPATPPCTARAHRAAGLPADRAGAPARDSPCRRAATRTR